MAYNKRINSDAHFVPVGYARRWTAQLWSVDFDPSFNRSASRHAGTHQMMALTRGDTK